MVSSGTSTKNRAGEQGPGYSHRGPGDGDAGTNAAELHRILLLDVGGRTFAIAAEEVREIVPFRRPTRLPGAPAHVSGILNLRGTVVAVIDLAQRLGHEARLSENRCIVLLQRSTRPVGLVVDNVRDVIMVDAAAIEKPRDGQSLSELARGVVRLEDQLVMLLDIRLLVSQVLLG